MAPAIIRVDDDVDPGDSFMLYGEGMQNARVYAEEITSSAVPTTYSADAIELEVVSSDKEGQNIVCKMPNEAIGGSYNLWVENEYGTSKTIGLNVARNQWVSTDMLALGMEFYIYGKNLSLDGLMADDCVGVCLSDGSNTYYADVTEIEPYRLTCNLPEGVSAGEYRVYVTSDGYIWRENEDKRTVTVVENVSDPYGLGQAWADQFNWNNKVTFTPTTSNALNSVTSQLQTAIDDVSKAGGGVVYLPEGTYEISSVTLKTGVVLAGDGKDKTIIRSNGEKTQSITNPLTQTLIKSDNTDRQGLVNLTLTYPDTMDTPPILFTLGGKRSDTDDQSTGVGKYYFAKNISLGSKKTYNAESDGDGRIVIGGIGHILIDGCDFTSYLGGPTNSYVSEYVWITNNKFDSIVGNTYVTTAYYTLTDNIVTRNYTEGEKETNSQGFFMRGFSYVAGNDIRNLGRPEVNDGEVICTENFRGEMKLAGKITAATANTVNVDPCYAEHSWDLGKYCYAPQYLVITDGRGMGQYAVITGYNEADKLLKLDRSFKILPNETSVFTVQQIIENPTIYNNYTEDAAKGLWLYNDNIDGVIANNIGVDTQGAFVNTIYKDGVNDKGEPDKRAGIGYFITIRDNDFSGGTPDGRGGGIALNAAVEGSDPYLTLAYGINIRNNSISDSKTITSTAGEQPDINGIVINYRVWNQQNVLKDVIKGVIIENNTMENMDKGITIGDKAYSGNYNYVLGNMTDNVYYTNNSFTNVTEKITDLRY